MHQKEHKSLRQEIIIDMQARKKKKKEARKFLPFSEEANNSKWHSKPKIVHKISEIFVLKFSCQFSLI